MKDGKDIAVDLELKYLLYKLPDEMENIYMSTEKSEEYAENFFKLYEKAFGKSLPICLVVEQHETRKHPEDAMKCTNVYKVKLFKESYDMRRAESTDKDMQPRPCHWNTCLTKTSVVSWKEFGEKKHKVLEPGTWNKPAWIFFDYIACVLRCACGELDYGDFRLSENEEHYKDNPLMVFLKNICKNE